MAKCTYHPLLHFLDVLTVDNDDDDDERRASDVSHEVPVRRLLDQPADTASATLDVPTPPPPSSTEDDAPPPWEPHFDDLSPPPSSSSSSSLPHRRPLDPPPPCFSVPSPLRIRSHAFPPFRIPAISDTLADGFRLLYPHHVLEHHGIHRADWIRFLEDLGIAARLASAGLSVVRSRSRVPVAPLLAHRIFPTARPVGVVCDRRFAWGPVEEVRALIQIWNQCALERRKMRTTLQVIPVGEAGGGKKRYALLVMSL